MNRRTTEIFGLSRKRKMTIIGGIVLIVLVIAAWLIISNQEQPTAAVVRETNQVTGASTEQPVQEAAEQEASQEQTTQEELKYYQYEGQCAFDVKQKQDDVQEVQERKKNLQEALDKLNAEYETKKKELEEAYLNPTTDLQQDLAKAERELKSVESRLRQTVDACRQARRA